MNTPSRNSEPRSYPAVVAIAKGLNAIPVVVMAVITAASLQHLALSAPLLLTVGATLGILAAVLLFGRWNKMSRREVLLTLALIAAALGLSAIESQATRQAFAACAFMTFAMYFIRSRR